MSDLPPQKGKDDVVHSIAKAVLGSIPVAGAAASELFASIISPPLEKRRDEWMKNIGERIKNLEIEKKLFIPALTNNELFITTVMHASQIAIKNHSHEKLEALTNAISNTAISNPPEESKVLIFLNYVDTFTDWHIRILHLFQNSNTWFISNNKKPPEFSISSSYDQVLLSAYPELSNNRSLYDLIDKDLSDAGLLSGGGLHAMMSSSGAFQKRTTALGDEFLRFISKP
jgi:hypothetical protein